MCHAFLTKSSVDRVSHPSSGIFGNTEKLLRKLGKNCCVARKSEPKEFIQLKSAPGVRVLKYKATGSFQTGEPQETKLVLFLMFGYCYTNICSFRQLSHEMQPKKSDMSITHHN